MASESLALLVGNASHALGLLAENASAIIKI